MLLLDACELSKVRSAANRRFDYYGPDTVVMLDMGKIYAAQRLNKRAVAAFRELKLSEMMELMKLDDWEPVKRMSPLERLAMEADDGAVSLQD